MRSFDSLLERIEIVKTFTLSRIYYVASVLPLSKTLCKRIETIIGRFLWASSGKVLKVAIDELKLPLTRGGLNLTCIYAMSRSLRLSSLVRLLKSDDRKSAEHVWFWIGEILVDFLPNMHGQHARRVPSFYDNLAQLFIEARLEETFTPLNWTIISNRMIYRDYVRKFKDVRVSLDSKAWKRLFSSGLTSSTLESMYLLMHNKLPLVERLFRIRLANDPYCSVCLNFLGVPVISDRHHFFCLCQQVSELWTSVKQLLNEILNESYGDLELLLLSFNSEVFEKEAVWLISTYVYELWRVFVNTGFLPCKEQMFGFLKFKFKVDQLGSRSKLRDIPGLS